ncbi:TIGR02206 family membrane protein [Virgibacillus sp. DJP39]|uniref:YwaF family protein n=1 Tax=Virgibacillus sp. DJP39 TaxID=3409790 RepID=UPI003BB646B6
MLNHFKYKYDGEYFTLFSMSHLIMLAITIACIIVVYSMRNSNHAFNIKYFVLFGLIGSELTLNLWYIFNGVWNVENTLPFQLCSISLYLSIFMLITEKFFLFEITFFLGIGGALQALLTPELYHDFPHYRYFHFFVAHIAIVLASIYMASVKKYKPTLKSVWKAMLALNLIAIFVYIINQLTGGNYMFLSWKPSNASLIDYLGEYPWYLLSLEFVALTMFLILYVVFPIYSYSRIKK